MDAREETTDTPECSNGIRSRGLKERLHLGSRRTLNKTFTQTIELEIAKQTVRTSIRLQKMNVRTLWRAQPPLKQKKRPLTID
jgi:hypothetical protein